MNLIDFVEQINICYMIVAKIHFLGPKIIQQIWF